MPCLVQPGEPLPAGCDSILDPEDVRETPGGAEVITSAAPGRHVRQAGGDVAAGHTIVAAGGRLRGSPAAAVAAARVGPGAGRRAAGGGVAPQDICPPRAL